MLLETKSNGLVLFKFTLHKKCSTKSTWAADSRDGN